MDSISEVLGSIFLLCGAVLWVLVPVGWFVNLFWPLDEWLVRVADRWRFARARSATLRRARKVR